MISRTPISASVFGKFPKTEADIGVYEDITGVPENGLINFVSWSPNGKKLAFTVRFHGDENEDEDEDELFVGGNWEETARVVDRGCGDEIGGKSHLVGRKLPIEYDFRILLVVERR